jgi:nucleoside-diphosphate-sugar epimerase
MRRTLVIGGTRNLGPDLVAALLGRGDRVTVLNRGLTPDDLPPAVERLHADRSDADAFARALAGRDFDAVVDTTLYTGAEAASAIAVLRGRTGRYVLWSNVYLVRTGPTRPFREEDFDGPVMPEPDPARTDDHRNWTYGMGKRDAEERFRAASAEGFPFVALRMPMIHSARDHYRRIAAYVHRLLDGGPLLLPEDELPVRHVYGGDVIAATLRALESGAAPGGAFNISQDETLTLEAMLGVIAAAVGRPLRARRLPRSALERLALLPACSPFSDPWMSALANERGRRVLGLTYTPVRDYVPAMVEAALRLPSSAIPGYDRRPEELALAAA